MSEQLITQIGDEVRPFTEDELKQYRNDQAAITAAQAEAEARETARKVARDAAVAHAKSLGFTDEMIAVMYPNLLEE